MNTMVPLIRVLLDAGEDRGRASALLACPDNLMLKYHGVIRDHLIRAHFEAGLMFVDCRVALLCAVRNSAGGLPGGPALELETMRAALAAYAAGAELVGGPHAVGASRLAPDRARDDARPARGPYGAGSAAPQGASPTDL